MVKQEVLRDLKKNTWGPGELQKTEACVEEASWTKTNEKKKPKHRAKHF